MTIPRESRVRALSKAVAALREFALQDASLPRTLIAPDFGAEIRIRPWTTLILLAIMLTVHALTPSQAPLLLGAERRAILEDGEWYRLFTAAFIHINLAHLFGNCLSLLFVGWLGERVFGPGRMLAIFCSSAVFGVLASLVTFENVLILGCSDGLTALAAAMVPFTILNWSRLKPVFKRSLAAWILVFLWIIFQDQLGTGLSPYVHLDGLAFGIVVGLFYRRGVEGVSESTYVPSEAAESGAR